MSIRGRVDNGVVILPSASSLPDGTLVDVTPIVPLQSTMRAANKHAPPYPVSNEQRDALLNLIGIWKTGRPPGDEEVDRIVDEYRTRKHG